MAGAPTPERPLLPDSVPARTFRNQSKRAGVTPTTSTTLPFASKGSARTVVFDHQQHLVCSRPRRSRLSWCSFAIVIVVPVLAAAYYYFLVAADQYVAEFRFALRSAEPERRDPALFLQES